MGSRTPARRLAPFLLGLFGLLASGCTFNRTKTNLEDFHERIERVEVGVTTSEDLLDILGGPPTNIIDVAGDRRVWLYTFGDSKTSGLTLIVLNISKSNVGIDSAIFILDPDGVVEEARYSRNSEDLDWDWWAFGE